MNARPGLAWTNVDSTSKLCLAIIKYINHTAVAGDRRQERSAVAGGSNAKARISLSLLILKTRRNYVNKLNCLWPPGARR